MVRSITSAIIVALLVPAPASALPPRFDVEVIAVSGEVTFGDVCDMNDVGQVSGTSWSSGQTRAFRHSDDVGLEILGTLPAPFNWGTMGYGLNRLGDVTGVSYRQAGQTLFGHAFRYSDAEGMVDLGTLGGDHSEGRSINLIGAVAGYSTVTPGSFDYHAFMYYDFWGGMQDLGVLPGAWGSFGYDINICNQVVGESGGRPFRWTPVIGMEEIAVPNGGGGVAHSINDAAHVAGYLNYWDGEQNFVRAFVYSDAEGVIELGVLPGTSHSMAHHINNNGVVVGICIDEVYQPTMFVWTREDGMRPLLEAVNPMSEANIFSIAAINERGELLAQGTMPNQPAGMMRLMPVAASDLNFDHAVDLQDFSIFSGCFGLGAPGAGCDEAQHMLSDLDGNQKVDLNDFAMFSSEFGQ